MRNVEFEFTGLDALDETLRDQCVLLPDQSLSAFLEEAAILIWQGRVNDNLDESGNIVSLAARAHLESVTALEADAENLVRVSFELVGQQPPEEPGSATVRFLVRHWGIASDSRSIEVLRRDVWTVRIPLEPIRWASTCPSCGAGATAMHRACGYCAGRLVEFSGPVVESVRSS